LAPAAFVNGVGATTAMVPVAFGANRITVNSGGLSGTSGVDVGAAPAAGNGSSGSGSPPAANDQAAAPLIGPSARPFRVGLTRRSRRIRVGRNGVFSFQLTAQDVDTAGRVRYSLRLPPHERAAGAWAVSLRSKAIVATAGLPDSAASPPRSSRYAVRWTVPTRMALAAQVKWSYRTPHTSAGSASSHAARPVRRRARRVENGTRPARTVSSSTGL
jgi:hypothetical protein